VGISAYLTEDLHSLPETGTMSFLDEFGGHTMVGRLRLVMMCRPGVAGWSSGNGSWHKMGYHHHPDFETAQRQHEVLVRCLQAAGIQTTFLTPAEGLSMDAVYTHDASFMTDFGAIIMRMTKPCRQTEPQYHRRFYERHQIPVIGEIQPPGTAEAGDLVWLGQKTLLVGRGYRTNTEGIHQLRDLLSPKGIEIIVAPLSHGAGPDFCLHLMSLISLLDEHTALVDSPLLAVQTLELLKKRAMNLIEMDEAERNTLGCNVLALDERHLVAMEENHCTNRRLREAGFELHTFPASEIGINGGGGPTCLTRPLLRS